MKTRHEKTLNDAEVEALLAAIDRSGPEIRPAHRGQNSEEHTLAAAWEIDIHDSSVTELNH